jgi:transposase
MQVTTIGIELAKHWFHVHAVNVDVGGRDPSQAETQRVLTFLQSLTSCVIGMEAFATAGHLARELTNLGHEVKLMLRLT